MNTSTQIDKRKFEKLSKQISASSTRDWTIMELSGQTNSFLENNLLEYLPPAISIVHGPSCSICSMPLSFIDGAIKIAQHDSVIFCASGDLFRLRGSSRCDLLEIKAQGADLRVIHTPIDSLDIAIENRDKRVVFFSAGFEAGAQSNARAIWQARRLGLDNYFVFSFQGCVPSVAKHILKEPSSRVQGMIGLGDVCAVTGLTEFEPLSKRFNIPIVVTGFEPIDMLEGIRICVNSLEKGLPGVENQFTGGVSRDGNRESKSLLREVFEVQDCLWRGIGHVENGGYRLKDGFQNFDAKREFGITIAPDHDSPRCISREILLGFKKPTDCPLFVKSCHPEAPLGATMVSADGVCGSYYSFKHDHDV